MGSERILAPALERLQAGVCKAWGGKHPKAEVAIFSCTARMHRATEEFITCPGRWMVGIFSLKGRFIGEAEGTVLGCFGHPGLP